MKLLLNDARKWLWTLARLEARLLQRAITLRRLDSGRASPAVKAAILRLLSPFPSVLMQNRIERDLDTMPLWDAVTQWVARGGLAESWAALGYVAGKLVLAKENGQL